MKNLAASRPISRWPLRWKSWAISKISCDHLSEWPLKWKFWPLRGQLGNDHLSENFGRCARNWYVIWPLKWKFWPLRAQLGNEHLTNWSELLEKLSTFPDVQLKTWFSSFYNYFKSFALVWNLLFRHNSLWSRLSTDNKNIWDQKTNIRKQRNHAKTQNLSQKCPKSLSDGSKTGSTFSSDSAFKMLIYPLSTDHSPTHFRNPKIH